jgi:hypothetical protein
LAALRQTRRQFTTNKTNDFYESEGFGNDAAVLQKLEESQKKRKRASIKA